MVVLANSAESRDGAHLMHGYANLSENRRCGAKIVAGGRGIYVYDQAGKEYIEAASGMWCTSLGFDEEELVQAAVEQFRKLPYYHTVAGKTLNPTIDLAEKLASLVPIQNAKLYFALSGSEANDFLIKFLWYYNNAIGRPQKKKIIARLNGYHGATIAATSLTGIPRNHQAFDLPIPRILHTDDPHYYRNGKPEETEDEFTDRLVGNLELLILQEGPETVAGFIAEPCTGAGGVVIPSARYYRRIQEVLARHEILFLDDEVITGFGRTGHMFGAETFGIRPDTMTLGKGLSSAYQPISAIVLSDEIYRGMELGSDHVGLFAHGATYSGHPVAAAVALRTIEIIERRGLIAHVRTVGRRFAARLAAFRDHPLVGEVRCVGLMGAIEFVADKRLKQFFEPAGHVARIVRDQAEELGVIARQVPAGDSIAFSPPLIITEAQVDELFDRFGRALELSIPIARAQGIAIAG